MLMNGSTVLRGLKEGKILLILKKKKKSQLQEREKTACSCILANYTGLRIAPDITVRNTAGNQRYI